MDPKFNYLNVEFQLLHPDAKQPVYSSDEAAGADLHSIVHRVIAPGERMLIKTGVAIALQTNTFAEIRGRSGLAFKKGIGILGGIIDSDYRGEIGVILHNTSNDVFEVEVGDRIAQLLILPVFRANFIKSTALSTSTERGANGFGSTGVSGAA